MRVSVQEAAQKMNVCQQFIREGLKRQSLPIGCAVKMSSRWTYYISSDLLDAFLGVKKPPAATGGTLRTEQKGHGDNTT